MVKIVVSSSCFFMVPSPRGPLAAQIPSPLDEVDGAARTRAACFKNREQTLS
jgi:hypothetical protein